MPIAQADQGDIGPLFERRPLVFTAHSAETAYLARRICAFVFDAGGVPVNPFMSYGYFLEGLVEPDVVRRGNNNLIMRCDELWAFGEPSDGVEAELAYVARHGMPVRRFALDHYGLAITEAT